MEGEHERALEAATGDAVTRTGEAEQQDAGHQDRERGDEQVTSASTMRGSAPGKPSRR
jgi:hypothetical protein